MRLSQSVVLWQSRGGIQKIALFGKRLSPHHGKNSSNKQRKMTVHHYFKTRSVNSEKLKNFEHFFKCCRKKHEDRHRKGRPRVASAAWKCERNVWRGERNVVEYNTIDLVKVHTKKKNRCSFVFFLYHHLWNAREKGHNVLFQPRCNLDFGHWMAVVYVQSFRLIKWTIAFLFKMLYQDCPNVPNWFINTFSSS